MTRKEAIEQLKVYRACMSVDGAEVEAYNMAIQALGQEPCDDAISRQAVLELIADYDLSMGQVVKGIHALPSVKPQEPKADTWSIKEVADTLVKHGLIVEQEPFDIETYCKEHFMVMVDKDVWEKAEKALKQEPKTGHWIKRSSVGVYECSECHKVVCLGEENDYVGCPYCFARMESEE